VDIQNDLIKHILM